MKPKPRKSNVGSVSRDKRQHSRLGPKHIHLDQLASYHIDGQKVATLREVFDPSVPTMSFAELTEDRRVALIVSRLRQEPDTFAIGMIGPGIIDKTRAIAEVEARSRIGRLIMEIEQDLLLRLTASKK